MTCPECERLRITMERYKLSAGMWRNKCYELGGTPLPWEAEELIQKAVEAEREACAKVAEPQDQHDDPLTAWKIAAAIRARGQLWLFERAKKRFNMALDEQRELIASFVADMCQGLDANTIAEAIRNGGNDE